MTEEESPVIFRLEIKMKRVGESIMYTGETSEDTKDAEEYRRWVQTDVDLYRLFWAALKVLIEKMGETMKISGEKKLPPARKGIS